MMSNSKPQTVVVLLVDSEAQSRAEIRSVFEGSGHTLVESHSVEEALELVDRHHPALVLSELGLSDGSGFSLCRQLRDAGAGVRFMMVSRWARESDRILAFECGADDFLAKPFFARELASRVRAVLRRNDEIDPAGLPSDLDAEAAASELLTIDADLREIKLSGRPLALTPSEFRLLRLLVEGKGRIFSRSELVAQSTGEENAPGIRSIDAHIKSIRQKMGPMSYVVETIRGVGYRYTGQEMRDRALH